MIALEEAVAVVLAGCAPLPSHRVPLGEARGCVLAEDVVAEHPVPAFANTAMDGYAVRAVDVGDDVPVRLPVVGEVAAGHPAERALGAGEAMRIFTGAPIPEGADAIVIVEDTERLDGGATVEIHRPAKHGAHIRPAGDDLKPGDVVAAAGDELVPGRIGVLRSVGRLEVVVHPRPRVGVLSTGDELVTDVRPLGPGEIYDSNRPTMLAMVDAAGGEAVDLGHAADDEQVITHALEEGVERCDLLLTTGGVSMGDTDLVKVVLDRLGDMRWMQVAIKPAKPLAFGTIATGPERKVPAIGLPGNPVSSMVSFELFGRPALRRLGGHPDDRLARAPLAAVVDESLTRRSDGKVHFVRVAVRVVDGEVHVRSAGGQGSHQLSAMSRADALAILPDGEGVAPGDRVQILPLGELSAPPI